MNKKDLVNYVAERTEQTKKASAMMVDAVIEGLKAGILTDGKVGLVGFGTFKAVPRKARTARNPQNGEPVEVPARMVPAWKPSNLLKEKVAEMEYTGD